jgi:hypothetical protein
MFGVGVAEHRGKLTSLRDARDEFNKVCVVEPSLPTAKAGKLALAVRTVAQKLLQGVTGGAE